MLRIEFLGEVLAFKEREEELRKVPVPPPLNLAFCAATAGPKSR